MFEYIGGESQFPGFNLTTSHIKYQILFSVVKATLESQMSICQSVRQSVCPSQKPISLSESSIYANMPIYWSLRYLSAIMPISFHANQWLIGMKTPSPHIVPIGNFIYRLSDLLLQLLSHFGLFLSQKQL